MTQVGISVGKFEVHTTSNSGHGIDFYADRLVERMINVADTAPEPIRAQAIIFKDSLRALIVDTLQRAITSDRATTAAKLSKIGVPEVAEMVRQIDRIGIS